jgi:hypothetical protein
MTRILSTLAMIAMLATGLNANAQKKKNIVKKQAPVVKLNKDSLAKAAAEQAKKDSIAKVAAMEQAKKENLAKMAMEQAKKDSLAKAAMEQAKKDSIAKKQASTDNNTNNNGGNTNNNGGTTTDNSGFNLGGLIKTVGGMIGGGTGGALSNGDIVSGLKEALSIGTDSSTQRLNKVNGYFANAAIKILMPEDAKKVESTLRGIGLGKQVDDAILSMNRAAEDAAVKAAPIFWNAIKGMTITDGLNILRGPKDAATSYLRNATTAALTQAFRPVIDESLGKVGATKYWNDIFSTYNKVPFVTPVNSDLASFVTERALSGIFYSVAQEELKIRENPAARVTDLLKKVFGSK